MSSLFITYVVLTGAILVLGIVVWLVRRWQRGQNPAEAASWTFDDLRKMRDQGQLTEAEYQQLRATLVGTYAGKKSTDSRPAEASQPLARPPAKTDDNWDWVAGEDPRGGFDVKKESPG